MTASPAAARTDARRLVLGLGLLPLIGALILVVGIALGARGDKIWMLGLALLTSMLLAAPAVIDQARPPERRHMLFSLLALVHFIYFVMPIFTGYLFLESRLREIDLGFARITPGDVIQTQLAVLLSVICIFASYATPIGRGLARLARGSRYDWSSGAALGVACIGIPLGWAITLGAELRVFGPRLGAGILGPFIHFTLYGISLLTLTYLRYRSRAALMLLLVLIPITMGFNFFTGSKGRFFGPLIMVFLAYLFYERRIRKSWVIAGIALVTLFYPASEFYRNVLTRSMTVRVLDMIRDPGTVVKDMADFASNYEAGEWVEQGLLSTANRFDGIAILAVILSKTPEEVPFQGGWTIGYAFLSFVPRLVWPDKPMVTTGRWVTDNYTLAAGLETATGSTWIGELYFNFGWLGIGFGMIFVGIIFRTMHEFLFRLGGTIPLLLAAVMLMNDTVRNIGGDLLTLLAGVVFTALIVGSMHVAVRFLGGVVPAGRIAEPARPAQGFAAASAARSRLSPS